VGENRVHLLRIKGVAEKDQSLPVRFPIPGGYSVITESNHSGGKFIIEVIAKASKNVAIDVRIDVQAVLDVFKNRKIHIDSVEFGQPEDSTLANKY